MRLLAAILLVGSAFVVAAAAAVVMLAWEKPSGGVAGSYRVWAGTNSAALVVATNCGPVTNLSLAVPFRAHWFFRVSAVGTNGLESAMSNLVEWEPAPTAPVLGGVPWVRLSPVIERSTNGLGWVGFVGAPTFVPGTNAQELFRARELVIENVDRVGGP